MIATKPQSPYKGLVPFEDSELDALLFFGRERESEIIGANLLAARLTVLYGPSGVGKTSVLRAGVAHRLRKLAEANLDQRGHPEFVVAVFDGWSDDPVAGLRDAVHEALAGQFGSALLDEREGEPLAETLARWTDALACDVILILDQAEEYFLYHDEDSGFAENLPDLVTRSGLRVRVLLSIRDDALAKLDRFKGRIPNLFANYLRLDHLDRRAARDAIVKPVERYGEVTSRVVEIEPALIEAVLDETATGKVDLGEAGLGLGAGEEQEGRIEAPYLQLVLERIWEEETAAGSDVLRAETLAELGGAEAIVRTHLRRAVEELSEEQRDVAADVFRYLVTPSGMKIAHGVGDLAEYASVEEQQLVPVLATLGRERIVRTVDGAGANGARFEIFHDVLADAVLAWRREQELERERRSAEQRHRRLVFVALGSLSGLVAMTLVAIYAFAQRSDAQNAERKAHARELVATAAASLPTDPDRSLALALETARMDPTSAAEDVLRTSLVNSRVRRIIRVGGGGATSASYSPDGQAGVGTGADGAVVVFDARTGHVRGRARHPRGATTATFSPDGLLVATGGLDQAVRIWDAIGDEVAVLRHRAVVRQVAFGPEGVISATADGRLTAWEIFEKKEIWMVAQPGVTGFVVSPDDGLLVAFGTPIASVRDAHTGRLVGELKHAGRVTSAAFDLRPSGRLLLVTGSADQTAKVWDVRRGVIRPLHDLQGHTGQVTDVAFSPAGDVVLTTSTDGTARLWDVATGKLLSILIGHTNYVVSGDFSPGGLFVVTASTDGTARVWRAEGGNTITVLVGHEGSVGGAAYSAGGLSVLTFGADGTARIWDPDAEPLLGVFGRLRRAGHDIEAATFSPDATLIAATGRDALTVFDASGKSLHTQPGVVEAEFSPDGRRIAGTDSSEELRIWDARRGIAVDRFEMASEKVAFASDGRRVAVARDGALEVWDESDGPPRRAQTFEGAPSRPSALAWSPDGRRIVVGTEDGDAHLWDESGNKVAVLRGHRDDVLAARFSRDGDRLVTASADHDARLWDAASGRLLHVLRAHFALVSDARFSDDGRWIVTAGPGKAAIWDARSGRRLLFLRGHEGILRSAAFRPGTHTVATVGEDGTVRAYDCELCGGVDELMALARVRLAKIGRTPTPRERRPQ